MFGALNLPMLGAYMGNLKAPLYASVAQLVEYTTDNRAVTGSNPVVCTIAHCADCKIMYIFVENGRQVFDFPVILMVKVVERHWGPLVKEYIQTILFFPPGVDVYDCNTQIQKRGYSSRLAGVSFRVSPNNKTGGFYLSR